jgi:predicted DNA repair protein MutK
MPSAGLLALLDDITSLLDDVATMTKVASKKTAAVIGDDLALNAHQITGTCASRELPVVTAVAKGSLLNKLILIPAALLITAFIPALIKPLLMIGGAFLCFEGVEKILHKLLLANEATRGEKTALAHTDPLELERERIKGAILTDFILSAEILVIALGAASGSSLPVQALTLCAIGLGMTIIVYGSVALIVKADDVGLKLQTSQGQNLDARLRRGLGRLIILSAPRCMKLLSIAGTLAMFLVGGEILVHGIPPLENAINELTHSLASAVPAGLSTLTAGASKLLAITAVGVASGLVIVISIKLLKRLRS